MYAVGLLLPQGLLVTFSEGRGSEEVNRVQRAIHMIEITFQESDSVR